MVWDGRSLQNLIDYLGLSLPEAGALIGLPRAALARDTTWRPYAPLRSAMERLSIMATEVDAWVAAEVEKARRDVSSRSQAEIRLLIYRRDEELPTWSEFRFASVHRVAMARVASALRDTATALIVFESEAYSDWLRGRADSPDAREAWAAQAIGDSKFFFKIDGVFSSTGAAAARRNREAPEIRLRRRRPKRKADASISRVGATGLKADA